MHLVESNQEHKQARVMEASITRVLKKESKRTDARDFVEVRRDPAVEHRHWEE